MREINELNKSVSWIKGAATTIGGVIGAGILALPSIAAEISGPASILGWIFMAIFSLPIIIVIGMMSSRFPSSGGMADYARRGLGDLMGSITGFLIMGAMPIGMPVTALIGADFIGKVFSWPKETIFIAAAIICIAAVIFNCFGVEIAGKVQVIIIVTIMVMLIFTIASCITQVKMNEFMPFFTGDWTSIFKTMNRLFFAFMGWEMVGHLAEEFYNPRRDIPLSLIIGFIVINVLYISIAFITIGSGVYKNESSNAMIQLITNVYGKGAGAIVGILGFIICYCTVHTYITGFSRLIYSEAREGSIPKVFSKLHPKYKSPYVALLFFIPICLIIFVLSYIFSLNLSDLISIPSTTFLSVYIISMIGSSKVLKSKLGKVCSYLSVILSVCIFVFAGKVMIYPLTIMIVGYCIKIKSKDRECKEYTM